MDTPINKERERKPAKLVFNAAKAELALFDIAAGDATTPHNLRAEVGIDKQEEYVFVKTVTDIKEGIVVRPAIDRASNSPCIIDLSSDDDDDSMGREEDPTIFEPATDSKEGILTPQYVSWSPTTPRSIDLSADDDNSMRHDEEPVQRIGMPGLIEQHNQSGRHDSSKTTKI